MDAAGNLNGTNAAGVAPLPNEPGGGVFNTCHVFDVVAGCGSVFKLDVSGNETGGYPFTNSPDGAVSLAGLIMDAAGNLYGTTEFGGTSGQGTVFKLDSSFHEAMLYSFAGSPGDGANPIAGLIMDAAGNLYGTTLSGGAFGFGTVFKLDPLGNETVLHSFTGGDDGARPSAALTMDATGNLLGTSAFGGASGFGTVFKLRILTPQQSTQSIVNSVNALFSQGVVNGGQHNSLVRHLQHTIELMNAGKNNGAIGNLNAFIGEVNDLLSSGVLSPSQAALLVRAAQSVIASL